MIYPAQPSNSPDPEKNHPRTWDYSLNPRGRPGGKLHVPSDKSSRGFAKVWFRLCKPHRWFLRSSYIRAVEEIRKLIPRIQATRQRNTTCAGLGYRFPDTKRITSIPYLEFVCSCNEDIKALRAENPWMTSLDAEMVVEGWTRGFLFALRKNIEKTQSS